MNRASKNESASTSGSDREAPSEGSLKHTVLTSSSEISLMVDFTNNCELNLTVWWCVLEPPIIMSANYFNLGGGADHSSW